MNWKSIISIIALLAIGFIAGFFTNRHLTVKKAKEIAILRQAKGMEQKLLSVLELEATQAAKLSPIIKSHFAELAQLNKEHQEKRATIINDLSNKISPSLNEEQQQKLENFSKRLKRLRGKRKMRTKKESFGKKSN